MTTAITPNGQAAAVSRRALLGERLRQLAGAGRRGDLSFSQQRLGFLDQLEPGSPLYNIAAVAHLRGALNEQALEQAVNQIIVRHEVLRTEFLSRNETPEQ